MFLKYNAHNSFPMHLAVRLFSCISVGYRILRRQDTSVARQYYRSVRIGHAVRQRAAEMSERVCLRVCL